MGLYLKILFFLIFSCFFNIEAHAYIGPGMSGGALVAVLGFVVAIFAGLFGLIYIPIKRLIKKLKNKKKNNDISSDKK